MDEVKIKNEDSSEGSNAFDFCDDMEAQPQLMEIKDNSDIVCSAVNTPGSAPLKGITWPSSSWTDRSHKSAFQPYRPIVCNTVLTNLQRGNTETETPKQESTELSWHQKAGRGDIMSADIPSDCKIDRVDSNGMTALMWASSYGQYLSVELLLKAGAYVNMLGLKGETPLLLAAAEGHLDVLRVLISNGAKVNHTDKDGNTAMIYAAYNNHHHCIHELLYNGADLTIKNKYGLSAYSLAVRRKNQCAVAVIKKYLLSLLDDMEPKTS